MKEDGLNFCSSETLETAMKLDISTQRQRCIYIAFYKGAPSASQAFSGWGHRTSMTVQPSNQLHRAGLRGTVHDAEWENGVGEGAVSGICTSNHWRSICIMQEMRPGVKMSEAARCIF